MLKTILYFFVWTLFFLGFAMLLLPTKEALICAAIFLGVNTVAALNR